MTAGREVATLDPEEYEGFARRTGDLRAWPTLASYERWRKGLEGLRIFWSSPAEPLGFLGVRSRNGLVAAARLSVVPFYDRRSWGSRDECRGEVQDLVLHPGASRALEVLLAAASARFRERGIAALGVSAWVPSHWALLEAVGLNPYARSVLLAWDPSRPLAKEPHPEVRIETWNPGQGLWVLRRVQRSSWGFFLAPDPLRHEVLVAWLGQVPVGSAYLNRSTGNLDFGVHVVRRFWRQRIGTALVEVARRRCLEWGLPRMSVVRLLRALYKLNPHDRRALCFYSATGARLWREVRGFRHKRRSRSQGLPPLKGVRCR